MCEVCARNVKYSQPKHRNVHAYPLHPSLTFGCQSSVQRLRTFVRLVREDLRHSRRATVCLYVFAALAGLSIAGSAFGAYVLSAYVPLSPYLLFALLVMLALSVILSSVLTVGIRRDSFLARELTFFRDSHGGARIAGVRLKAIPVVAQTLRFLRILGVSVAASFAVVVLMPTVTVLFVLRALWPLRYLLFVAGNLLFMASIGALVIFYRILKNLFAVMYRGFVYGILRLVCEEGALESRGLMMDHDGAVPVTVAMARLWLVCEAGSRTYSVFHGLYVQSFVFLSILFRFAVLWPCQRPAGRFYPLRQLARNMTCGSRMCLWLWLVVLSFAAVLTTVLTLPFGALGWLIWLPMKHLRPHLRNPRIFRTSGMSATSAAGDGDAGGAGGGGGGGGDSTDAAPVNKRAQFKKNQFQSFRSSGDDEVVKAGPSQRFVDTAWHFDPSVHGKLFGCIIEQKDVTALWPLVRDQLWHIRLLYGKFRLIGDRRDERAVSRNTLKNIEIAYVDAFPRCLRALCFVSVHACDVSAVCADVRARVVCQCVAECMLSFHRCRLRRCTAADPHAFRMRCAAAAS
jgi:hypothetical protein